MGVQIFISLIDHGHGHGHDHGHDHGHSHGHDETEHAHEHSHPVTSENEKDISESKGERVEGREVVCTRGRLWISISFNC